MPPLLLQLKKKHYLLWQKLCYKKKMTNKQKETVLSGFRPGLSAMAEALGLSAREVRAMLARVRGGDGDAEPSEEKGPAPSEEQLTLLESGFRRLLLQP